MKCEIIRKPIVLERVEVNLLKSSHCYLQRVTTRYRHFFKKDINIHFFINLAVAPTLWLTHVKLRKNVQ